jgi:uridine kinase
MSVRSAGMIGGVNRELRKDALAGVTEARLGVLWAVVRSIPEPSSPDCVLVGVDGVDGAGKTTFADELDALLRQAGRPTVRISVDDFHNVRAVRHQRGRDSAEGFWLDAFNYSRLYDDVLIPLGRHGSRRYSARAHDLHTDEELPPKSQSALPGSVVVIDGLFLHRDELAGVWDLSIFLDVSFEVSVNRFTTRDGTSSGPDDPSVRRYVEAQLLYFRTCAPQERASVLIDNTSLDAPRLFGQE